MSADANLVFYGIRVPFSPEEAKSGDIRKHELVLRARAAKLDYFFTDLGGVEPDYALFLGKMIALTGPENSTCVEVEDSLLREGIDEARRKLIASELALNATPKLYVHWLSDS